MRILILVTEGWYFLSHFLDRARGARDVGHEVTVVANLGDARAAIEAEGFRAIDFAIGRRSVSPARQWRAARGLAEIYQREKPDLVHHVALKPVVIGGLAARRARVPRIVSAPTGMGFVFTSKKMLARAMRPLTRSLLHLTLCPPGARVIFQNRDDMDELIDAGLARREAARLIRGSGVDTERFRPREGAAPDGPPVVTLAARMLWDKGVGEFAAAARILAERGVAARLRLVGDTDVDNPACVAPEQLRRWSRDGLVEWLGHRDDMPAIWAESHIACLPSYREGLPRALLEALAAGLPVVTTDTYGCRDIVETGPDGAGLNGVLTPVRDAAALAAAIERLALDPALRQRMGAASRALAEREFSAARIVRETLAVYQELA